MKKLLGLLLVITALAFAKGPKYKVGDCITPTNPTYTWYGKYAKVTALEDGYDIFKGTSTMYYLNFREYDTRANKFVAVIIDNETKKVPYYLCSQ